MFFGVFLSFFDFRYFIFKFVCLFESLFVVVFIERFKVVWEEDLGVEFFDDVWDKC